MVGYTSQGLGVSDLPLRFHSRGGVAVITLRRASPEVA
jgi:predicted MPP superfamily phosphohydrolase